mmetsp:Transcript_134141/g.304176  ORF Transcript_134141/g.304176 Transcript_134141/m.304176 type:complete len:253 (-) Transcript_134141:600-1358(-)
MLDTCAIPGEPTDRSPVDTPAGESVAEDSARLCGEASPNDPPARPLHRLLAMLTGEPTKAQPVEWPSTATAKTVGLRGSTRWARENPSISRATQRFFNAMPFTFGFCGGAFRFVARTAKPPVPRGTNSGAVGRNAAFAGLFGTASSDSLQISATFCRPSQGASLLTVVEDRSLPAAELTQPSTCESYGRSLERRLSADTALCVNPASVARWCADSCAKHCNSCSFSPLTPLFNSMIALPCSTTTDDNLCVSN